MRFNANSYTINGSGANVLTLTAGFGESLADGEIQVAAGLSATVNATLTGSVGLTKTLPGTLVLGGQCTYVGGTTVSGGVLKLAAANALPVERQPYPPACILAIATAVE